MGSSYYVVKYFSFCDWFNHWSRVNCQIGESVQIHPSSVHCLQLLLPEFRWRYSRKKYKDINTQNSIQTAMSGATFAASNGIFLSIGIPYLLGRHDLVIPMMVGASLAIIDATILYKVFDTEMFGKSMGTHCSSRGYAGSWKGKNSVILMIGMVGGIVGKIFGIPTDILGVGWMEIWALVHLAWYSDFEYTPKFFNIKLGDYYVPHGVMIGAGFVALIQMIHWFFRKRARKKKKRQQLEHNWKVERIYQA